MPAGLDGFTDPRVDRLEALLSSGGAEGDIAGYFRVVPHVSDDDVGELTFVASAGCSQRLARGSALGHEGSRWFVHAGLGDVDDVQDAVDLSVPGEVESVVAGLSVALA